MKKFYLILLLFSTIFLMLSNITHAQHSHAEDSKQPGHHTGLHFVHPLFTESVSPDTKLRMDYQFLQPGSESETELEGEYAFSRIFSVEAGVHYDPVESSIGNIHLLFKFANYAPEEQGILLGYGLSLDLPTGSGHSHGTEEGHGQEPAGHQADENIYQFSPFLNAGVKAGNLEVVGWTRFHIPTNQKHQESVSTSLGYNVSALYHLSSKLQPLMELNGTQRLSGINTGNEVFFSPGLRVKLLKETPLIIGVGAQLPLNGNQDADTRFLTSAFYHF